MCTSTRLEAVASGGRSGVGFGCAARCFVSLCSLATGPDADFTMAWDVLG